MSEWKFITNHGAVMLIISQQGRITARKLAERVRITERSVLNIIKDLEDGGYLTRKKVGRENVYTVNAEGALRHHEIRSFHVGELVELLSKADLEKK
ncbi:MAG: winged helix-turn-helix transcriptional regulator [Chloroflexi bacterium]|nr:winged helix-turn-helix transcriptional regulator [Chloroflexota bacterium]